MLKKFAALGLSAAIAFAPLAALAQTDQSAPAAPAGAAPAASDTMSKDTMSKKPMKKHMGKKSTKKPMAPAAPAEAPKS